MSGARSQLARASFAPPLREAALLLAEVTGLSEASLLARDDQEATAQDAARFDELLARRLRGEPVAYLLGRREFYGRTFMVDPRVLIPRPETEHAIEAVLASPLPERPRLLDVGTGSGCLAVTLACELPAATVVASDLSFGAIDVARSNARALGVGDSVSFVRTDLFLGLDPKAFDLVVSNPPYVDRREQSEMSPEVCDFEPPMALFPPDGRGESTLELLLAACSRLRSGARVVLEIGRGQLGVVQAAAALAGLDLIAVHNDYAGIARTPVFVRR